MNVQALMTQGGIVQSMSQLGQDLGSAFREYNDIKTKREAAKVAKEQAADEMSFRRDSLEAETTRQNASQAFTGEQNQLGITANTAAASAAFGRTQRLAADKVRTDADVARVSATARAKEQRTAAADTAVKNRDAGGLAIAMADELGVKVTPAIEAEAAKRIQEVSDLNAAETAQGKPDQDLKSFYSLFNNFGHTDAFAEDSNQEATTLWARAVPLGSKERKAAYAAIMASDRVSREKKQWVGDEYKKWTSDEAPSQKPGTSVTAPSGASGGGVKVTAPSGAFGGGVKVTDPVDEKNALIDKMIKAGKKTDEIIQAVEALGK